MHVDAGRFFCFFLLLNILITSSVGWERGGTLPNFLFLKKNLNIPRPPEHPPVKRGNANTFRWAIGCTDKASLFYFPSLFTGSRTGLATVLVSVFFGLATNTYTLNARNSSSSSNNNNNRYCCNVLEIIIIFCSRTVIWTCTGGGRGCKMQGVHSHESRCLRHSQHRLLFIPSTLSYAVFGPASRPDTPNPTPQSPYQPIHFFTPYVDEKIPYALSIKKPFFVGVWMRSDFSLSSLIF